MLAIVVSLNLNISHNIDIIRILEKEPDRVMEFCNNNDLQLIVRAHECTANNAGAILVLGRDLVVVPKLIHPLPPAISSPETSPERHIEDTWMQELNANRPPTPTRGRPQSMMPIYGNSRTCDILVPDEAVKKTGFQDMMDDNLSVENQAGRSHKVLGVGSPIWVASAGGAIVSSSLSKEDMRSSGDG
ncbi:Serine/threonine-protein phosphatase BSL3 [Vitis vinifera]|uniref:Serine/threonine-protein phosphatase BSL3 n=1 Tax=Vitis vinifera TaxID=29760 RepID=A0A438IFP2_VITVI|nr:Serine/threonine-protein phosphatase BSL3 [Vitis vinifera]